MSTSIGPGPSHTSQPVRQGVATGTVADPRGSSRTRRRSSRPVWDEEPSIPAQGAKGIVL
ncbi:MAG: carbohydrate ABC transporter permease, partial [Actinomycetales bacterium]|nr:carbohydrate ABC transporter permease [Actinomycetales bacterium]